MKLSLLLTAPAIAMRLPRSSAGAEVDRADKVLLGKRARSLKDVVSAPDNPGYKRLNVEERPLEDERGQIDSRTGGREAPNKRREGQSCGQWYENQSSLVDNKCGVGKRYNKAVEDTSCGDNEDCMKKCCLLDVLLQKLAKAQGGMLIPFIMKISGDDYDTYHPGFLSRSIHGAMVKQKELIERLCKHKDARFEEVNRATNGAALKTLLVKFQNDTRDTILEKCPEAVDDIYFRFLYKQALEDEKEKLLNKRVQNALDDEKERTRCSAYDTNKFLCRLEGCAFDKTINKCIIFKDKGGEVLDETLSDDKEFDSWEVLTGNPRYNFRAVARNEQPLFKRE